MKVAVYNKNSIEISSKDKVTMQSKGAIVKVLGCGLCGTDIVKVRNSLVIDGTVLGHEVVGKIIELNSDIKNLQAGDKVAIGHHVPCYKCVYCKNKNFSMCKTFKSTNIIPGGFSEYIFVSEAHLKNTVFKIPQHLTELEASFMEPLACCIRAVKRANVLKEDNVLITGLGSIGILLGQVAKHYGAKVYGCDLIEERLELASTLEFDKVIKYSDLENFKKEFLPTTNNIGADKILLASGSVSSLPLSTKCIRDGGTILVFSSVSLNDAGFNNNDIYYKELTVLGSYSPSPEDLKEALNLISNGIIKVKNLSTEYIIDNIPQAFEDTISNKIMKAYIKL